MARTVALALFGIGLGACIARDRLVCSDDTQCTLRDDGVCIDGGCAYPDGDCASGLRFSDFAGERSGQCVEGDIAEGSSTAPTTTQSTSTSASESSGSAESSGSTSEPGTSDETGPMPSVCDDVACSGNGTCVPIDDAPTCACAPGYFGVGLECVLDPCDSVTCYFVDDVMGDDANDGSRELPWRTLGRLSMAFADAQPGDHYLLKRGGVWGDADGGYRITIANVEGTEAAPIVVAAYGPLEDGAPRLFPGLVRIANASHIVLRDLDIEDDPDDPEVAALYGTRPCVWLDDSDHVVVQDNRISSCNARGVWVSYGSSYTTTIGNSIRNCGADGVSIIDLTWLEPIPGVGPHHWVIDNVIETSGASSIVAIIQSEEVMVGDAKIVRNRVSDSGSFGIQSATTGYTWIVDNVVARAMGTDVWMGALNVSAQGDAQLTGNIAFEHAGNGIHVQHTARVEANTVVHGSMVGHAIVVDDLGQLSATDNLVFASEGDSVHVEAGAPVDHIVMLDDQVYGDEQCSFSAASTMYDLASWRRSTGFDLASTCELVPGIGDFPPGVRIADWDAAFMDAFVPDSTWAHCAEPVGARDCDGEPRGPAIAAIPGFDESNGVGWAGPLIVRQRYDVLQ
ncbi:MAG TPA: right-handed parallel beta-helix repeat-containing protein [Nannocystaceae bacterium]|nr:right-handed parallel beta-helix repeat-containing protein [Nannocystaceae bacterium]